MQNVGVSSLDNFGVDLCPLPDENLHGLGKLQSTTTPDEGLMVARYVTPPPPRRDVFFRLTV